MDQISTASVITIGITAGVATLKVASAYFITIVMPKLDLLLEWLLSTRAHASFSIDVSFGKSTSANVKKTSGRSSLG
jgi:hypothetical protein